MRDLILYSARTELIAVLALALPSPPPHAVPAGSLSDGMPQFILRAKLGGG